MILHNNHLQTVVDTGTFEALIGEVEGAEFECKAQPYRTDSEAGKRELAKDVSAFANASGGFIFIGVKTKQSETRFGDEVEAIRPFSQLLVNTSQYIDITRAWVFPEIADIDISWVATNTNSTLGVVVIKIPRQDMGIGPFLITKTLDDSKHVETVFGYASRKGDKNPPLGVKELQNYLRSGMHYQERIEDQLNSIENLIREGSERVSIVEVQKAKTGQIEARITRATEHGNLKDGRLIIVSAQPLVQSELTTIFMSTAGSIRQTLERPPILRRHGWNMETLDQAKIQRGEFIRVTNGSRKVIDLYRDGAMIFAATADENFLAWGKVGRVKINPLALIEVIYSFVDLYRMVLADYANSPKNLSFRIDLRNMHLGGEKSFLSPYSLKSIDQQFGSEALEAPEDNWSTAKTFDASEFDVAAISYDLIREIYLWFGLEQDKIPYTKDVDGIKMIDSSAIASGG